MSLLNNIGFKNGTDKSSIIHDYLRKYEKYFQHKRIDDIKLLEIGVLKGQSVKTWKEYFYNGEIIGVDISPECKQYEEDRIKIEIGDQTDKNFLKGIVEKHGPFDIVIDDGSHNNTDVVFTFQFLVNHLKSNGTYVVEDSVTSYWEEYGGGYKKDNTIIEYFKNLVDEVNFYGELTENFFSAHARKDELLLEQFRRNGRECVGMQIESINFLNSIILIIKR